MGYDNTFNVTSYSAWGGWSYTYDAENRLLSAGGGGHTASFIYDALGRCVKRTIRSQTRLFAYDGWKPTVEWIPSSGAAAAWNIYRPGVDEIVWRFQPGEEAAFAR